MESFLRRLKFIKYFEVNVDNIVNILGKFTLEQVTKTQRGNRITLFLLRR